MLTVNIVMIFSPGMLQWSQMYTSFFAAKISAHLPGKTLGKHKGDLLHQSYSEPPSLAQLSDYTLENYHLSAG
jgi:hypothetical protein